MDIIDSLKRAVAGVALDQQRKDTLDIAMQNIALLQQQLGLLRAENERLRAELAARPGVAGVICANCGGGDLRRVSLTSAPYGLAALGHQIETLACQACGHEQAKRHKPS